MQVGGTKIRMLWLPDPLRSIREQLTGPMQNRELYTTSDVLVISAGAPARAPLPCGQPRKFSLMLLLSSRN